VPDEVIDYYRRCIGRGEAEKGAWQARFDARDGDKAVWDTCQRGRGLEGWSEKLPVFEAGTSLATRQALNRCITATTATIPGLLAGSADLTGNTGVKLTDGIDQSARDPEGRQIHYGIREHAMGAAMTGMARHGGVLPVGGTFFVFSDYMRPAVRLAALSESHVIYSWTHDSVGLGEDGPTHQPVEHLASLRAIPGLRLIRPADANETAHSWRIAVDSDGPTALVLSRQSIPVLEGTARAFDGVARGGYVLVEPPGGDPDIVLIGTGSEVALCVEAARVLAGTAAGDGISGDGISGDGISGDGISGDGSGGPVRARVVSLPSWDLFALQSSSYRDEVLPPAVPSLAVEAAASFGWERYADDVVAIDHFGASAPGAEVLKHFGYTPDNVAARAHALLSRTRPVATH
jgi:transketolase